MKATDICGQTFNRLTVKARAPKRATSTEAYWLCQCACGSMRFVLGRYLRSGHTKSCGCLRDELARARTGRSKSSFKHGRWDTPEYWAWREAKARCSNPKHHQWKNYGARGIDMCDEWRSSFSAFFQHLGPKPNGEFELDRIDNDGNYEPGNVRWTGKSVQAQNRRFAFRRADGTYTGKYAKGKTE